MNNSRRAPLDEKFYNAAKVFAKHVIRDIYGQRVSDRQIRRIADRIVNAMPVFPDDALDVSIEHGHTTSPLDRTG